MPAVELSDDLFEAAQRRAIDLGFKTPADYIAYIVGSEDLTDRDIEVHFFTPDRIARINAAKAEVAAGQAFTLAEADDELRRRRERWLKSRDSK